MTYLEQVAVEIETQARPGKSPDPAMRSLFLMYALLALAKGVATEAADVHDAWVAWMVIQGEHHASMVSFEELPPEIQHEDAPYVTAIRAVVRRRS